MPKKKDKVRETEVTENLKCVLTEDEVKSEGEHLARLIQDKAGLENDLKSVKASFKAKIEAAEAGIISASNKVRDKYEYRNVDCIKHQNFSTGMMHMVRTDTDEMFDDHKMSVREKQDEDLFDAKS